jgi:hypothetical protein
MNIWRVDQVTTTLQRVTPLITRRPTRGLPRVYRSIPPFIGMVLADPADPKQMGQFLSVL